MSRKQTRKQNSPDLTKESDSDRPSPYPKEEAKLRIRLILREGETVYSRHLKDDIRSGRHGADFNDILHVLTTGDVVRDPVWDECHRQWKYNVEGRDLEDEDLRVITVIIDEDFRIFLVTAY